MHSNLEIVNNSYNDRTTFFNGIDQCVHTPEVFETENMVYVQYRLQSKDYQFIYDKNTNKQLNISNFTDNNFGWIQTPFTTFQNWLVTVVEPWQFVEEKKELDKSLKVLLNSDRKLPIMVKIQIVRL